MRAHVRNENGRWYCKGWAQAEPEDNSEMEPMTFQDALSRLETTEKYLVKNTIFNEDAIDGIAANLQRGQVRVVSDGSFFESAQRAAFCVRIESHRHVVISKNILFMQ